MRATFDLAVEPGFASDLLNLVPMDPMNGGPLAHRVGFSQVTSTAIDTGAPQWLGIFYRRSGFVGVMVQFNNIYTWSEATPGWTVQVTSGDLTAAGIVPTGTTWYAVTFGNQLVFTDGAIQPFMWDGTLHGGLTKLTNAPTKVFGAPTVYYAKLFFIKDVAASGADRATIVWSEENQPNVGYEATVAGVTYSNVWSLTQTSNGPLQTILGTNDGLYYFRLDSVGVVRGAANATFVAAGIHDAVSAVIGTASPRSVTFYNNKIYFTDNRGRPWALPLGGNLVPLWRDLPAVFGYYGAPNTTLPLDPTRVVSVPVPIHEGVLFTYDGFDLLGYKVGYLFSITTDRCISHWTAPQSPSNDVGTHLWGPTWSDLTNEQSVLNIARAAGGVIHSTTWYATTVAATDPGGAGTIYQVTSTTLGADVPNVLWRAMEVQAEVWAGQASGAPFDGATMSVSGAVTAADVQDFNLSLALAAQTIVFNTNFVGQRRALWGVATEGRWLQVAVVVNPVGSSGAVPFGIQRLTVGVEGTPVPPYSA